MRELTSHKVPGLNEEITIRVLDKPGAGGACNRYQIYVPLRPADFHGEGIETYCHIQFQQGPVGEAGPNGISMESLLAVVEDRLKGFQSGQFACRESALALTHIQEAMHWLHHRTRERAERGVEGTSVR